MSLTFTMRPELDLISQPLNFEATTMSSYESLINNLNFCVPDSILLFFRRLAST